MSKIYFPCCFKSDGVIMAGFRVVHKHRVTVGSPVSVIKALLKGPNPGRRTVVSQKCKLEDVLIRGIAKIVRQIKLFC